MINKEQIYDGLTELRVDAVKSEKENDVAFTRIGLNKEAKKIVADKQYWNGYLDAISNVEKQIKKLR